MTKLKPCGTTAAARRHRLHNEPVCDLCRKAEAEAQAEREKRKRAAKAPLPDLPSVETIDDEVVLEEILITLRGMLRTSEPREAAGLAKGIRDTLTARRALRKEDKKAASDPVSASDVRGAVISVDEIAKRRAQRRTAA